MSQEDTSQQQPHQVPYYLMPVAALCGIYSIGAGIKLLFLTYKSLTFDSKKSPTAIPPTPIRSKQFLFLLLSFVSSVLLYGFVCAQVNNSLTSLDIFDPYEILSLSSSSPNMDEIKSAYRKLSKIHHPDKGGDATIFHKINLAYKALSSPEARSNWETYGHPDGPQTQTLSFALPSWLLHPEGKVAIVLLLLYFAMFGGIIWYFVRTVTKKEKEAVRSMLDNSVAQSDISYLATHLRPNSTHLDVLYYIATCPESIEITQLSVDKGDELKQARLDYLNPSNKGKKSGRDDNEMKEFDLDNDDDGWADDDDEDDEAVKAAKERQAEKEKLAKQVAEASGKDQIAKNIKIEGIDDGVLGQEWVERTLKTLGQWPPKFGDTCQVGKMTFFEKGKGAVGALEHRAVRRNLCMTLGRLNAQKLNMHPELLEAGKNNLIDPTYFRSTMEYRQRTGLLLEAALRVAGSTRSYRLYKTIVECVAMFKIGTTSVSDEKILGWFKDIMQKTYGGPEGVPSVVVGSIDIETPDEDEIATEDTCKLEIEVTRPHAESFTKQKIAMAQKQGIPPQLALQTFREGWWILIRCKKLDGSVPVNNEHMQNNPILAALDGGAKRAFESEIEENRLLNAWPFIVSNISQTNGKVNVTFRAPSVPGKYKFFIDVKSQEFLGCDQVFTLEKEIIDKALLERKEEEKEEEENEGDDDEREDETKKTK